ncbi:MAG: SDR family oxidoreductase [Lentisphaerae bacterium]|jgi:NAD(P)-dependent dehydrogenase (short-subunit alcohol dehydrogenase family)|nr:SDR family oxidoreductase [Lentisphaerota bacterium]MBT4818716.1 SDR family oxidoreductase [Lentisphaerota bacterium]MBT5611550.1 SDR family oxidoreductase [Lentisphaerota bacterium]MBT7059577.1 SDR family oxidoreductase [Lentisphaerota bacterium]MBT7844977.1 SDR family oxidoreductase [Lentisphaerota bacterium]
MTDRGPYDLSGKVCVITGGSGVLCGALAQALAKQGGAVVILGHSRMEKAEELAAEIGGEGGDALALQADVLDRASLEQVCGRVLSQYGHVDVLINGAGGARKDATTSPELSFFELPEAAIRWVFDLNFMGTFLASQVFGEAMVNGRGGSVLNVASMGALRPLTRSVAYSAAKSAVVNFTEWLAVHMSQEYDSQVRVNALVPGFFLTDQNRFLLLDVESGGFSERGQRIVEHTPMGRLGAPDDLVGPALFLLSESARFVHGTTLVVDGGLGAYGGV